jgi:hypothetical protein
MDKKIEAPEPRIESCACGQRFRWHPVSSRRIIVVSFQKNLFEFGERFEYPVPINEPLQFGCLKCHQSITLPVGDSPVARRLEKVKTAPVRLPAPDLSKEDQS